MRLRRLEKAAWEIAAEPGVLTSTVFRYVQAAGFVRLWHLEEAESSPERFEPTFAGSLFHVAAFASARSTAWGTLSTATVASEFGGGVVWEVVIVCFDDYTRLAYAEVHPEEDAAVPRSSSAGCFAGSRRWVFVASVCTRTTKNATARRPPRPSTKPRT